MSIAVSFILRSKSQNKPVTVSLRIRPNRQNWIFPTPVTILSSQWDAKRGRPSTKGDNATNPYLAEIRAKLNDIEDGVSEYISKCEAEHTELIKTTVADIISEKATGRTVMSNKVPTDISEYLHYFIVGIGGYEEERKAMHLQKILNSGSEYTAGTIKTWKMFEGVFKNFRKYYENTSRCVLCWDRFNNDAGQVVDAFIAFCNEWGYTTKSTNKLLINFRALVYRASDTHHLHKFNDNFKSGFHKVKEKEGCAQTRIYLTDSELQSLYDMPLSGLKEQVRDVFLVGCYTGQRVSDYARLKSSNFYTTSKGNKVVKLTQKKTGKSVTIPIIYDNLKAIIEKYDYKLPNVCDVIINRYIKDICKDLSETVPSLKEPIRTIITLRDERREQKVIADSGEALYDRDDEGNTYKHKYELVCTHTARRSCLTNLFKSGRYTLEQIRHISGHKSISMLEIYLSQSDEEIADEIANIADNEGLF